MSGNAVYQFARTWARTLVRATIGIAFVILLSSIFAGLFAGPLLIGVYLEYGVYPWEVLSLNSDQELSWYWWVSLVVWWVFAGTGVYAAAATVGDSVEL